MLKNIIETERLILREFTLLDTDFIIKLLNTGGWLYFIGSKNVKNTEDAKHYLENVPIKSYKENGYGLSLIALKDSFLPIGMCGLLKRETLDYPDINFALLDEYMGKGYAFEMANATIQHAKYTLKISKIVGMATPDNKYSIQLLKKIGLIYEKMIALPHNDEELMLFSTS